MKNKRRKRKKLKNTLFTDLNKAVELEEQQNQTEDVHQEMNESKSVNNNLVLRNKQMRSRAKFTRNIYQDSDANRSIVRANLKTGFLKNKIQKQILASKSQENVMIHTTSKTTSEIKVDVEPVRGKYSSSWYSHEEKNYIESLKCVQEHNNFKKPESIRFERDIVLPKVTKDILCLLNTTAEFIAREGAWFEAYLKEKEILNPDYVWLFEDDSLEKKYLQHKVLEILYGRANNSYKFFDIDLVFYKPKIAEKTKTTPEDKFALYFASCEVIRRSLRFYKLDHEGTVANKRLGPELKKELNQMLKTSSLKRNDVCNVMGFCLTYIDCFEDCIRIITTPFYNFLKKIESGPNNVITSKIIARFMHRLYILSDCLYNTNAKLGIDVNYSGILKSMLPLIFFCLGICKYQASGRITAKDISQKVETVLDSWKKFFLFQSRFIIGLHVNFDKTNLTYGRSEEIPKDVEEQASEYGIFTKFRTILDIKKLIKSVIAMEDKPEITETEKYKQSLIDPELDGLPLTDSEVEF